MSQSGSKHKIPAGALQLTIFIGVLIALILSAFFLFMHTGQTFKNQGRLLRETIRLSEEGIQYAVSGDYLNRTVTIDRPDLKEYQELTVTSRYWGAYEWVTSTAKAKAYQFERNALLGGRYAEGERPSLILANTYAPLVVVGNTQLTGDARVSEYGIKAGSMGSAYYRGKQLIHGKLIKQEKEKFDLPSGFYNNLKYLIQDKVPSSQGDLIDTKEFSFYNSFKNDTKWLYDRAPIYLEGLDFGGNIIIKSAEKITVSSSSKLDKVLLVAPEIEIKSGFRGNLQAFASKSISIGEGVQLDYPCALVVLPSQSLRIKPNGGGEKEFNQLILQKNAQVKGCLYFLGERANANFEPEIVVDIGSEVIGEIYCDQNLELKGRVSGTVYTKAFVARAFGSVYRNHLYNAAINARDIPAAFDGSPFDKKLKGVAQWLY